MRNDLGVRLPVGEKSIFRGGIIRPSDLRLTPLTTGVVRLSHAGWDTEANFVGRGSGKQRISAGNFALAPLSGTVDVSLGSEIFFPDIGVQISEQDRRFVAQSLHGSNLITSEKPLIIGTDATMDYQADTMVLNRRLPNVRGEHCTLSVVELGRTPHLLFESLPGSDSWMRVR